MTILLTIAFPFLAAALIPLFYRRVSSRALGWIVLIVPVLLFSILATYIPQVAKGKTFVSTLEWIPSFGINLTAYLDGLSMIFALLITGVGSLVILYSIYYLSAKEAVHRFYLYLLLFMGAMLGVVLSDNLLVLYAFWELTSVSSFLLIAFWHHRKASRAGARKAMVITVSGGVAMLVGFLLLYAITGTFSIREIIVNSSILLDSKLFIPALICVLLGAFTKSAQFPFHIWLPSAMEAPTPVSAYLHSATMVKAGIYLVARMTPIFAIHASWFWTITIVGLITLFWGSFNAVKQNDLKALLAYSTISQLGLIMSLLGLGSIAIYLGMGKDTVIYTQATFAALFHLINHSTFKGALFMMVGIVDHEVGTRDIRRLGGLAMIMPFTFTIALIGSMSMAGLPPFNGFLSKEMFFTAMLEISNVSAMNLQSIGILFPIVAWVASVFTFIYCVVLVMKTFFGPLRRERLEKEPHEAPFGMLVSPFILITLVVLIFFFPNIIGKNILKPAMSAIYPMYPDVSALVPKIYAWHGFNTELQMTLGVVIVGLILYKLYAKWRAIYTIFPQAYTFDALFDRTIHRSEDLSLRATKKYMTGSLTAYMSYIYVVFVVIIAGYFIWQDGMTFSLQGNSTIEYYELILTFIMIFAAFAILFVKSRVTAVLLNGVLGYSVAFFFVIFRAPDLALTQLVVESVTTVLFLLTFKFLPELELEKVRGKIRFSKALISAMVGATVTLIGLAVIHYNRFEPISKYFEDAYELAGGKNIVNTILGDFRAFDTMLEGVVLFIAGLGIYVIIKLKAEKGDTDVEN